MLSIINDTLHNINHNPYKDKVNLKKRRGRLSNAEKEARVKYKEWEAENRIPINGFLDCLIKPNESKEKHNNRLVRYKPQNNV